MDELNIFEVEAVDGGQRVIWDIMVGVVGGAVWDGIKGAGGWLVDKAPGGASNTTWTNVGNSQMGA